MTKDSREKSRFPSNILQVTGDFSYSGQKEGFSVSFKCLSSLCCHCSVASCLKLALRQNQGRQEKCKKNELLLLPSPQELVPNFHRRAMFSPEDLFCLFFLSNSRIWTALDLTKLGDRGAGDSRKLIMVLVILWVFTSFLKLQLLFIFQHPQ